MVSDYTGTLEIGKLIAEVKEEIRQILKEDADAYFHFYVNEEFYDMEHNILSSLGLDTHRYHMSYLTDGTISYVLTRSYQTEDGYEAYQNQEKEFYDTLEKIKKNKYGKIFEQDNDDILIAAKRENADYYLRYPEYLPVESEEVKKEYNKIHFKTNHLSTIYAGLTQAQQLTFFKYIQLNKSLFDKEYFPSSDKPYLIITGNTPIDYNYGEDNFKAMIEQVINEYGNTYQILFKPHPKDLPDERYQTYFYNLGIKILPGKMPMEAISFIYPELYYGGFSGSTYLSVLPDKVLFFFARDENDMFIPLNKLVSRFPHLKYIQP